MASTALSLLPGLVALAFLLALLGALVRRYPDNHAKPWVVGLGLILAEEISRILYLSFTAEPLRHAAHAAALDLYLLAGTIFVHASMRTRMSPAALARALLLNLPARLTLLTLYAVDYRGRTLFYAAAALGCVTAIVSCILWIPARRRYITFMTLLWTGYVLAIHAGATRFATYWVLAFIYAMAAFFFGLTLPRRSLGRIAVIAGFSAWSLCFITHSATTDHPWLIPVAEAAWDLQKFLVAIGLLLVLLEDQAERSRALALHDELTGLPNRRLFEDRLSQALLQGARSGSRTGLFILDLNGFKLINDTFGHDAGDRTLCAVANNLTRSLRSADTLARIGGDEFAIIVSNLRSPDTLLKTLLAAIQDPIPGTGGRMHHVSASIGLAVAPDDTIDPEVLRAVADRRMYEEKARV